MAKSRNSWFSKEVQISVPSLPSVKRMCDEMTERIAATTDFAGHRVTRQIVVNALIIGLTRLGRDYERAVFAAGASELKEKLMAGDQFESFEEVKKRIRIEPGTPAKIAGGDAYELEGKKIVIEQKASESTSDPETAHGTTRDPITGQARSQKRRKQA